MEIPRLSGLTRRRRSPADSTGAEVETVVEVRPARVVRSEQCVAGLDSLADFCDASSAQAHALALGLLDGDRVRAENVLVETFAAVWQSGPGAGMVESDELERMLFRQVRSRCLDLLRRSQDTAPRENAMTLGTVPATRGTLGAVPPTSRTVRAELDALSHEQRISIERAFLEGRTASEIAEELDIPQSSVHQAMRSGLRSLADRL